MANNELIDFCMFVLYKYIVKLLKKIIIKHFSLVLILAGAASFFLANILYKEFLSAKDYGEYSIIITYYSLVYIFGLLGFEQVFLRKSDCHHKNQINTQKLQLSSILIIIFFTTLVFVVLFRVFYPDIKVDIPLLIFGTLSMISSQFLFTLFRLTSNFVIAQGVVNSWKIYLLVYASLFFFSKDYDFNHFSTGLSIFIIATFIVSAIIALKTVRFEFNPVVKGNEIFVYGIHFFISIVSFSLITFIDRFFIQEKFGIVEFGNYFYLTSFFLGPYSILQSYIGFKNIVDFKIKVNRDSFKKLSKKITITGLALGLGLYCLSILLISLNILSFDFNLYIPVIILMVILGIVRLLNALLIAAFGAKANIRSLGISNIWFVSFSVVVLSIGWVFISSIEMMICILIIIWSFRNFLYSCVLFNQIEGEPNEA